MSKNQQIKTEIETAIKELDPKLNASSTEFMAAATLLASARVGPNTKRIASIMHYPLQVVEAFEQSLTRNGIWKGGKVHADWTGEHGGAEFWMCVGVALGWMSRAR